jgi:hypothetical protein
MRLGFLRPLYAGEGDYASIYLDTSRLGEDAADVALRWKAARQRLADQGAGAATLNALEQLVTDRARPAPGLAAQGLAVFARRETVVFTARLPHPPRREISRYARLPHLMPLLAQYPPQVPQLRVRADRAGGEVMAVRSPGDVITERIDGDGWPVHKTSVGGWSQSRYQRSAEEAWEENAKQLAAEVTAAAAKTGAELIVIAGDIRARSLLLDHLGAPLRDSAVIVDKEVPADSEVIAEAAERAVRARTDEECRRRLEIFRAQLARGHAAEGLAETLAALRDRGASDVFVADDPAVSADAWVGPGLTDLAVSEGELRERGVDQVVRDRVDAAVVRAVAATAAELRFVPEGERPPRQGIGALLRYQVPES